MSGFEKFFVNRFNEYFINRAFNMLSRQLTLVEDSKILEIGAGKGYLSYRINELYKPKSLIATDYDPSQVELARAYFQNKYETVPSNVEFKVVDALDIPFEDNSFDAIFAFLVLHHVEKREWHFKKIPTALDEIHRVLKEGGFLVYGELFKKDAIRNYLSRIAFEKVYANRNWIIGDLCVFTKKDTQTKQAYAGIPATTR